ncbi:MAG: DUF3090 domain-containing protein [Acidimicrobiia bacterium]|jgi:uncharacterized repeat protein (TIGR03847 family)|nr:DUF3090 domain-containing protein [Acidimicrobiia bacterium]
MRSLGRVRRIAAGAMGPPGKRTFFLDIDGDGGPEWFLLEKEQLSALAAHGLELLGREASPAAPAGAIAAPAGDPAFRVAEIGLGAEEGEVVVLLSPDGESEPVAFTVAAEAFADMARQALAVVAAGRPRCRLCGLPVDPDGHACPGGNGDRRRR